MVWLPFKISPGHYYPEPIEETMPKKTSGDRYPLDLKGEMIFLGSIVCIPMTIQRTDTDDTILELEDRDTVLQLGFVSKMTQKRGIDVTIMTPVAKCSVVMKNGEKVTEKKWVEYPTKVIRILNPSTQVNVIDRESLKVRDEYHEALRMAANLL